MVFNMCGCSLCTPVMICTNGFERTVVAEMLMIVHTIASAAIATIAPFIYVIKKEKRCAFERIFLFFFFDFFVWLGCFGM